MSGVCSYFKVSRQAYYKSRKESRITDKDEGRLLAGVKQIRREQSKMGTRKVFSELRNEIKMCGRGMGRDKFFDLLRRHDLLVKRKRKYAITTDSNHPFYRYSNELEKTVISAANQAWVSDITYLKTREGFVYLSLVTDVYSRKIMGWQVDRSLGVEGTMKALKKAIGQCSDTSGLIHHSDRGIQYCCKPYTEILRQKGIRISMGAVGNCYENAIAERVNGILKDEYLLDSTFIDINQAKAATAQAIFLYNNKRPHWSLNLKKPEEVYQLSIKMSTSNQN